MELWLARLAEGDSHDAWALFDERYRPLILATIQRLVHDRDHVQDVFASVCEALSQDDFTRLKRFHARSSHTARFSTWLVAVVRNLTIDWLRAQDGRRRLTMPPRLSPLQQEIYTAVFVDSRSHLEAYELIATRRATALPFAQFLREVRATYRLTPVLHDGRSGRPIEVPLTEDAAAPADDPGVTADAARRLASALGSLPADVRLAVELFIIEEMSAADVARAVSWPNAKAVYNRVHRALATLRAQLRREGIGPGDL